MKTFATACFILIASCSLLRAGDSVLPKGWDPSLSDVADYLKQELEDEKAQQGINRLTARIASLRDAELLIAYVKLFERLDAKGQAALKEEQAQWLKKRDKVTAAAAKLEEGGTASPMEANTAYTDFTTKRIHILEERMKKPPGKADKH